MNVSPAPEMFVPAGESSHWTEIKRSKFIGQARLVNDRASVQAVVRARRAEHDGCNHVVHAFRIHLPAAASPVIGWNDDGEPGGTAGRPVMDVISGSKVFNVVVTVARFFGGIKLGAGGLVHAYSECAQGALSALPIVAVIDESPFSLEISYDLYERARQVLAGHAARIETETFGSAVHITGAMPVHRLDSCDQQLRDLTRGRAALKR